MKIRQQESALDRNLWINKAANTVENLKVILEIPDNIRFGEDAIIRIVNYDPFAKYEAKVSAGTTRVEDDLIYYTAPDTPMDGFDTLFLEVEIDPVAMAYFATGDKGKDYFYDETGQFNYVQDCLDDENYPEVKKSFLKGARTTHGLMMEEAKSQNTPNVLAHSGYDANETIGGNFRIQDKFPEYNHLQRSFKTDGQPVGGMTNYHVPSDIDLRPNFESALYQVEQSGDDLFYNFRARNSNMNEALGNTNDGYRFVGAIGSSLTAFNSGDITEKEFEFPVPIGLYPLEAVIPPEILSLCITSVSILPILKGNPLGHTYEWELISGTTAELFWISEKTDLELIINIGSIKADRVFRFWISRGTKYEKYYDVTIYGTPKDLIIGIPSAANEFGRAGTTLNLHNHDTRPILLTGERMWFKNIRVKYLEKKR